MDFFSNKISNSEAESQLSLKRSRYIMERHPIIRKFGKCSIKLQNRLRENCRE